MCGVLDDVLPVIGGIAGFALGGPAGAALGAGLGGFGGNYAQTHNFGNALEAGAISGGTSALGGWAAGLGSGGFDPSAAISTAQQGASTLGDVEQGAGGAALFGPAAGTGTAIGGAANSMGAAGLGVAGTETGVSGVGTGMGYLSGLGGTTSGTGLGLGGTGSTSDLNGVMNGTAGGPVGGSTPTAPLGGVAGGPAAGATGVASPAGNSIGSLANSTGTGSPMGFDQTGGAQFTDAGAQGAAPQGSLSSMYGPTSVAGGSPQGAMIAQAGQDTGAGGGVQFGALGQGTPQSVAGSPTLSSMFGGGGDGTTGASPWGSLAKTGVGMLQNYENQQAQNKYRDQISNIFSPNGAYAQQMNSNIQRQYAAQGRRSEVGPQNVQLAAALAQAQAQALGGNNYNRAATTISGQPGMLLNNALYQFPNTQAGNQAVGAIGTGVQNGWNSLSNLFSQ